jgi:hypothetical protein
MKEKLSILGLVIVIVVGLGLLLGSWAVAQDSDSQPEDAPQGAGSAADSDSNPASPPQVVIPAQYQPPASSLSVEATHAATVYFTPQDENTSTTVIFLYNTSEITATVDLQTFRLDGSPYIDTSILVPAHALVRICADTVTTVASSWQDVVLVNFTTSSTYARMSLPEGVKAEAYVVWNDGGSYDPLQVAPTLNIRFSTDPATVFLPAVERNSP